MNGKRAVIAATALGGALLAVGTIAASARATTGPAPQSWTATSLIERGRSRFEEIAAWVGLDDEGDVAPGTIDDGRDLLPLASVTLEDAIAAARDAGSGDLGEVDLEYVRDRLVYDIDIGDQGVKVDATTAEVLVATTDD